VLVQHHCDLIRDVAVGGPRRSAGQRLLCATAAQEVFEFAEPRRGGAAVAQPPAL